MLPLNGLPVLPRERKWGGRRHQREAGGGACAWPATAQDGSAARARLHQPTCPSCCCCCCSWPYASNRWWWCQARVHAHLSVSITQGPPPPDPHTHPERTRARAPSPVVPAWPTGPARPRQASPQPGAAATGHRRTAHPTAGAPPAPRPRPTRPGPSSGCRCARRGAGASGRRCSSDPAAPRHTQGTERQHKRQVCMRALVSAAWVRCRRGRSHLVAPPRERTRPRTDGTWASLPADVRRGLANMQPAS